MDKILNPVALKHLSQLDELRKILDHFESLRKIGVSFDSLPIRLQLGGIFYLLNYPEEGKIAFEIDTLRNPISFLPDASESSKCPFTPLPQKLNNSFGVSNSFKNNKHTPSKIVLPQFNQIHHSTASNRAISVSLPPRQLEPHLINQNLQYPQVNNPQAPIYLNENTKRNYLFKEQDSIYNYSVQNQFASRPPCIQNTSFSKPGTTSLTASVFPAHNFGNNLNDLKSYELSLSLSPNVMCPYLTQSRASNSITISPLVDSALKMHPSSLPNYTFSAFPSEAEASPSIIYSPNIKPIKPPVENFNDISLNQYLNESLYKPLELTTGNQTSYKPESIQSNFETILEKDNIEELGSEILSSVLNLLDITVLNSSVQTIAPKENTANLELTEKSSPFPSIINPELKTDSFFQSNSTKVKPQTSKAFSDQRNSAERLFGVVSDIKYGPETESKANSVDEILPSFTLMNEETLENSCDLDFETDAADFDFLKEDAEELLNETTVDKILLHRTTSGEFLIPVLPDIIKSKSILKTPEIDSKLANQAQSFPLPDASALVSNKKYIGLPKSAKQVIALQNIGSYNTSRRTIDQSKILSLPKANDNTKDKFVELLYVLPSLISSAEPEYNSIGLTSNPKLSRILDSSDIEDNLPQFDANLGLPQKVRPKPKNYEHLTASESNLLLDEIIDNSIAPKIKKNKPKAQNQNLAAENPPLKTSRSLCPGPNNSNDFEFFERKDKSQPSVIKYTEPKPTALKIRGMLDKQNRIAILEKRMSTLGNKKHIPDNNLSQQPLKRIYDINLNPEAKSIKSVESHKKLKLHPSNNLSCDITLRQTAPIQFDSRKPLETEKLTPSICSLALTLKNDSNIQSATTFYAQLQRKNSFRSNLSQLQPGPSVLKKFHQIDPNNNQDFLLTPGLPQDPLSLSNISDLPNKGIAEPLNCFSRDYNHNSSENNSLVAGSLPPSPNNLLSLRGSLDDIGEANLYPQFYNFLRSIQENKLEEFKYFTRLPKFESLNLKQAFKEHFQMYHMLDNTDTKGDEKFKVYLNYFINLAYLGSHLKSNDTRRLYLELLKSEMIVSHEPESNFIFSPDLCKYLAYIQGAWIVCSYVGPSLYYYSEDLFPLSDFLALTESKLGLVHYLTKLGYMEEFTKNDWLFKSLPGLK